MRPAALLTVTALARFPDARRTGARWRPDQPARGRHLGIDFDVGTFEAIECGVRMANRRAPHGSLRPYQRLKPAEVEGWRLA